MEEAWTDITLSSTPNFHAPKPANNGLILQDLLNTNPGAGDLGPAPAVRSEMSINSEEFHCRDDRRYKRMMKNRASAARSRDRRMAYMFELEAKKTHLTEENERLRKELQKQQLLLAVAASPVGPEETQAHTKRTRCKSLSF